MALQIAASPEGLAQQVRQVFRKHLGRLPDQGELAVALAILGRLLRRGPLSNLDRVKAILLGSREYLQLNASRRQSFLRALARDVLADATLSGEGLMGGSRQSIALALLARHRAKAVIVVEAFARLLGHGPDLARFRALTRQLLQGRLTETTLLAQIVADGEYFRLATS